MELRRLFESRATRRTVLRTGMMAMGTLLFKPLEAAAQVVPTAPPDVIKPGVTKLTTEQRQLVPPLLAPPKPVTLGPESYSLQQVIKLVASDFKITEQQLTDLLICECSLDPTKVNPITGASGPFQIMAVHRDKFVRHGWDYARDSLNPYRSSVIAKEIFAIEGWKAWDCKVK